MTEVTPPPPPVDSLLIQVVPFDVRTLPSVPGAIADVKLATIIALEITPVEPPTDSINELTIVPVACSTHWLLEPSLKYK